MKLNKLLLVKFTPFVLIILNLVIKSLYLTTNSIAGDEPFSIYYSHLSLPAIIEMLSGENNPPLHFFFLHYWMKLFGISALSVRLPSLIFSSFSVYFIYKIGKSFFNYRIALIASLLFSFSSYHIVFSHEARVYPLFALLTTMSMFYFLKLCNKDLSFKNYLFLLVVNILLLYSHYFGFFVVFIQALSSLFIRDVRQQLKKNLIYLFSLILLYIPNIFLVFKRVTESTSKGTWVKPPSGIVSLYNMLWQFSNQPVTTAFAIIILVATLVKWIVTKDFKHKSISGWIIFTWFIFPFLFMFIISYWVPMFLDRYLIFISIGYYLLLALCSDYLFKENKLNFIIPGVLILLFVATFNPNVDNHNHVKETVAKVMELKDKDTKVIICPREFVLNFTYYYNKDIFLKEDKPGAYLRTIETLKSKNIDAIYNIDQVDLNNVKRIIYIDDAAKFMYSDNNILPVLTQKYNLMNLYQFYDVLNVYEFEIKK